MGTAKRDTTPYWLTSTTFPQFAGDADADVVVSAVGSPVSRPRTSSDES